MCGAVALPLGSKALNPERDRALLPREGHDRGVGAGRLDGISQIFFVRHLRRPDGEAKRIERRVIVERAPFARHPAEDHRPFRLAWNHDERVLARLERVALDLHLVLEAEPSGFIRARAPYAPV